MIVPPTSNYFGHEQTSPTTSIYFASAAVAVESSRVTASSSASWSRFSPHSDFVDGHVSTRVVHGLRLATITGR